MNETQSIELIPYIGYATTEMIAEHYGISRCIIANRYKSHQRDFDSLGIKNMSASEFEAQLPPDIHYTRTPDRCIVHYEFDNGCKFSLHTNNNRFFSQDAIEYLSMLLEERPVRHKSHKASVHPREQEPSSPQNEQPDQSTDLVNADELCNKLAKAFMSGDTMKVLMAALDLDNYRISQLDQMRSEKEELKQVMNQYLPWTERSSAHKIVKTLSDCLDSKQNDIWNKIYYKLTCEYHLPLEERRILPLFNALSTREWHYFYRAVSEICAEKCIDENKLYAKAEVNTNGLIVDL